MPTIRKRGHAWQVQVRHIGFPTRSSSFSSKSAVVAWAQARERDYALIDGQTERPSNDSLTVAGLLLRYLTEITALKRSFASKNCRINKAPVLKREDTVITYSLGAHNVTGVRETIQAVDAKVLVRHLKFAGQCDGADHSRPLRRHPAPP